MGKYTIRTITNSKLNVSIGTWFVALIIVTCVTFREITLVSFEDEITRQFGSAITVTIPILLMLLFIFLRGGKLRKPRNLLKIPVITYFAWAIFSGIFLLINDGSFTYYCVAVYKFLLFILMFVCLTENVSFDCFEKGLELGFKISLIIQTIAGWSYVFLGILIPFIGNYSTSYRNGLSRMVGSFGHPGDFSLYMTVITIYFACRWLFSGKKSAVFYMLLAGINVYLSGARTMLLFTVFAVAIIMFRRHKRNALYKLGFVIVICIAIPLVIQSDIFSELFIENNFVEMFQARLIHWIIGFKVMFSSVSNFFFGVGLNSHVDYINEHFSEFASLVNSSSALDSDFARGMPIHNSYLIAGCELGIVGLVVYLRIYFTGIRDSIRIARNNNDSENKYRGFFICATFLAYMVYAIQGWALQKNFAITMLIILVSYLYQVNKENAK